MPGCVFGISFSKHLLISINKVIVIFVVMLLNIKFFPVFAVNFIQLFHVFLLLLFGNMHKVFQKHIAVIGKLLFKRTDVWIGGIEQMPYLAFIRNIMFIFQKVPAAVVYCNIAVARKLLPKGCKKRLLALFVSHFGRGKYPETTGVHFLHHFIDNICAHGSAPAFNQHYYGHFCRAAFPLQFTEQIAVIIHFFIILFFIQLLF